MRDKDWPRALQLLQDIGFTSREHFIDESKQYEQGFHLSLPNGQHILFEIHRHILESKRFAINSNGIWQRAYPSDFEGVPCLRMADEDVFCHGAWHSAIHRFMQHGRTLRDLELVLLNAGRLSALRQDFGKSTNSNLDDLLYKVI